jgi:hypothetical protein
MLRDDDDKDFKKEGLFDPNQPLFPDMIAGNYEEWTVINRSFSDHPFHMHQNPVLVTKINGITLPTPEWHDTLIVPAAVPQALGPYVDDNCNGSPCPIIDINQNDSSPFQKAKWGSITFRTHFDPVTVGCFVMHCHIINHEDIGMMQRVDVLPRAGESSGCVPESDHAALPNIERLLAGEGKFQICSAVRQSQSISDGRTTPANLSNRLADTGQ